MWRKEQGMCLGDEDAGKGRRETEHTHAASYGRVKRLMHKNPKYQALSAGPWEQMKIAHRNGSGSFLSTLTALLYLAALETHFLHRMLHNSSKLYTKNTVPLNQTSTLS